MNLRISSVKQISLLPTGALLALFFCFSAYGQQRAKPLRKPATPSSCTLELKDAPVIRSIRLGMSASEFLKMFPSATKRDNSRPEVGAVTYEIDSEENPNFAGSGVQLNFVWFVDDELSSVGFKYPEYEPSSLNDFIRQAAAKLNLPVSGWKNSDGLSNPKTLKCKDFDVMIGREEFRAGVGDPYLILSDYSGDAKIDAREKEIKRKEAEERLRKKRERQIFKP
jgi:hypothetical protein